MTKPTKPKFNFILRFYGPRLRLYTQKENEDLLYGIPSLHVALCFYFCVCRFFLQNIENMFEKLNNNFVFFVFVLVDAFGFLVFLFRSDRELTENLFFCHGEYFAKENFRAQVRTLAKSYCGNKTGGVAIHSAGFGSSYPLAELAI